MSLWDGGRDRIRAGHSSGHMGLSREQTRQQSRPREAGALGWEAAIPYTAEWAGSGHTLLTQGGLVTACSADAVLSVEALAPAWTPGRRLQCCARALVLTGSTF